MERDRAIRSELERVRVDVDGDVFRRSFGAIGVAAMYGANASLSDGEALFAANSDRNKCDAQCVRCAR